jgi:hypothetical protein
LSHAEPEATGEELAAWWATADLLNWDLFASSEFDDG